MVCIHCFNDFLGCSVDRGVDFEIRSISNWDFPGISSFCSRSNLSTNATDTAQIAASNESLFITRWCKSKQVITFVAELENVVLKDTHQNHFSRRSLCVVFLKMEKAACNRQSNYAKKIGVSCDFYSACDETSGHIQRLAKSGMGRFSQSWNRQALRFATEHCNRTRSKEYCNKLKQFIFRHWMMLHLPARTVVTTKKIAELKNSR